MKVHFFKKNKGYTIVELMISIVIGMMLIAAASATYVAQNRSFTAQESVAEVNTQSKIAHDLTSNDIRSAGFGVALDMSIEPVNGYTSILTPVDSTNAADAITVVGGFRKVGELWPQSSLPGISCATSPTVPLGATTVRIIYDPNINASEGPNSTDRRYLSLDGVDFVEVAACTIATNNNCTSSPITLNKPLSQNFPLLDTTGDTLCDTGRPVYLVEDITFCVDTTDVDTTTGIANPSLRRIRGNSNVADCSSTAGYLSEILAENVDDFQLAYSLDLDSDGKADNINVFVNGGAVADPSTIKAVRVNILARTDRPDPQYTNMGVRPAVIENRNQDQTPDSFRRRWWQTIVSVRNN